MQTQFYGKNKTLFGQKSRQLLNLKNVTHIDDKTDTEHNLGTFKITWTQAWLAGASASTAIGSWKTIKLGSKTKYYQYDGTNKAPLITPYNGTSTNKIYSYKENGIIIVLTENTTREYYNPVGLATVFGALAQVEYEDIVSNGSVTSDGHGAPSVTHINGFNADFKYLRKDKKRGNIDAGIFPIYVNNSELDITRQNEFLEALHKFGWGVTKNNLSHYINEAKKTLLKYCQKDEDHKDHLHIQGFKANYRN